MKAKRKELETELKALKKKEKQFQKETWGIFKEYFLHNKTKKRTKKEESEFKKLLLRIKDIEKQIQNLN